MYEGDNGCPRPVPTYEQADARREVRPSSALGFGGIKMVPSSFADSMTCACTMASEWAE